METSFLPIVEARGKICYIEVRLIKSIRFKKQEAVIKSISFGKQTDAEESMVLR